MSFLSQRAIHVAIGIIKFIVPLSIDLKPARFDPQKPHPGLLQGPFGGDVVRRTPSGHSGDVFLNGQVFQHGPEFPVRLKIQSRVAPDTVAPEHITVFRHNHGPSHIHALQHYDGKALQPGK